MIKSMEGQEYTSIPDTTDTNYWAIKHQKGKLSTFIPRNPELHKALKQKAWLGIQERLPRQYRSKDFGGPRTN